MGCVARARASSYVHVPKLIGLYGVGVGVALFLSGFGGEWVFARVGRLGGSAGDSARLLIDRAEGEENGLSRVAPLVEEWRGGLSRERRRE